jgi:transposase
MIRLAWRFLRIQEGNALAQWFQTRAADGRGSTRKTMIVVLARELLIATLASHNWRNVQQPTYSIT